MGALWGLAALGGGLKLDRGRYASWWQAIARPASSSLGDPVRGARPLHMVPQPIAFALMVLVTLHRG